MKLRNVIGWHKLFSSQRNVIGWHKLFSSKRYTQIYANYMNVIGWHKLFSSQRNVIRRHKHFSSQRNAIGWQELFSPQKNTQISVNDMNVSVRSFFIISWATCSKMLHIFHGQGAEKCSWYFLLTLVFWLNFFCDMAIFALLHTVPTTLKVVINYPISLTKWMGTYTFDPLIIKINYIGLMEKIFLFRFLFRFFLRQS